MKRNLKNKKRNEIEKFYAQVRGIIGLNNAQVKGKVVNFNTSSGIQIAISDVLINAKQTLSNNEFEKLFLWTIDSIDFQLKSFPKAYGSLKKEESSVDINDNNIISLSLKIIKKNETNILSFIHLKNKFYEHFFNNNAKSALRILDKIDNNFNYSLWSISMRLIILRLYFGAEEQKNFLNSIKKIYTTGLMPFLIHRVSLKTDINSNFNNYIQSLKNHFKDNKYYIGDDLEFFLTYKLLNIEILNIESFKKILYFEQKFNYIDLFQSMSSIIRRLVIKNGDKIFDQEGFEEFKHISTLIDLSYEQDICVTVFEKIFQNNLYVESNDLKNDFNLFTQINHLLKDLILLNEDFDRSLNKLINLLDLLTSNDNFFFLKKFVSYFEKFDSREIKYFENYLLFKGIGKLSNILKISNENSELIERFLHNDIKNFSIENIFDHRFEKLFKILKSKHTIDYQPDENEFLKIAQLFTKNEVSNRLIGFIIESPYHLSEDISEKSLHFIPRLILLHLYNLFKFSEDTQSEIAYILDEQLESRGIVKPSELLNVLSKFSHIKNLIIYLYHEVISNDILELCNFSNKSKDVINERIKILSQLINIDQENSTIYHEEILILTTDLEFRFGLEYIDGSRIHVDEIPLLNLIIKDFGDSLDAYKQTAILGLNEAEKFPDSVDIYLRNRGNPAHMFDAPKNEIHFLLLDTIHGILDYFLFHPKFGLDSFISKRIRHNSIIGYLRSAPEKYALITAFDKSNSSYVSNSYWLEKFPAEFSLKLDSLLSDYSEELDKFLVDIKQKYIQIKSVDNSEGLIFTNLTKDSLIYLESTMKDLDFTNEYFVQVCFEAFWAILETTSFKLIREKFISDFAWSATEIHNSLSNNINSLREELCDIHVDVTDIQHNIKLSNSDIERKLKLAGDWFLKKTMIHKNHYTLEKWLKISMIAAIWRHSSVLEKLTYTIKVKNDYNLYTSYLIPLADIIQILVGNISEHVIPYILEPIELFIDVNLDASNQIIHYTFEHQVNPKIVTNGELKLDNIRINIDKQSYSEKLRQEGNSGLYKIASIIYNNDDKGCLNFEFRNNKFIISMSQTFNPQPAIENILNI